MTYEEFLKTIQLKKALEPGSVKDIYLRESRLITEIAYGFQELVSPGRDVIFSFYIPANATELRFLKMNLYFPGFQHADYPLNSNIFYLPAINMGNMNYKNGAFNDFEPEFSMLSPGTGADGVNYWWGRSFIKINISPIIGLKLKTCNLIWTLGQKNFAGSGENAQHSCNLHAIDDYGNLDKSDWGAVTVVDYGAVNLYTDEVGLSYSKDVKTRIQGLIDSYATYACFRFKSSGEPTDVNNANNYRLSIPLLYCELEEDSAAKVGIYANNGKGFEDMIISFNENQEEIELQKYFSGVGKKQIKLSGLMSRRIEVLVRMGLKLSGGSK